MKAPPSMSQFRLLSVSRAYIKSLLFPARGTAAINGVPPCRFPPVHELYNVASSRGLLLNEEGTEGRCKSANSGPQRAICSWNTAFPQWELCRLVDS